MKAIRNEQEALAELKQVTSSCAGSDRFIARTIPLMIKQNNKIIELLEKSLKRSKRRKLSAYQQHCKRILLQGYTLRAAAESWNLKKRDQNAR
jgi:hypothetical protein